MKEFSFICPHCGQRFQCDPRLAGRMVLCPRCRRRMTLAPPAAAHPKDPAAPNRPPDESGLHLS